MTQQLLRHYLSSSFLVSVIRFDWAQHVMFMRLTLGKVKKYQRVMFRRTVSKYASHARGQKDSSYTSCVRNVCKVVNDNLYELSCLYF